MDPEKSRHAKILNQLNELSFALDVYSKVPAIITVYNIKTGDFIYINESVRSLLGHEPDNFLHGGVAFANKLVHPEDVPEIVEKNTAALKKANSPSYRKNNKNLVVTFEYRMRHKDGSWRWIHSDGTVFSRDDKGSVECVMNASVDITRRRQTEDAAKESLEQEIAERQKKEEVLDEIQKRLAASEDRYAAFIRNSNEGIWRFELEKPIPTSLPISKQIALMFKYGYLAEANEVVAKMYGVSDVEMIIGKRLTEFLPKSDKRNIEYLEAFIRSGYKLSGAESQEVDTKGKPKIFRNSLVGFIENGKLLRAWGTQQDVTTEVESHTKIQESQQHLALAMQAASMGSWEWDIVSDQLRWSQELRKIYNLPPDYEISYQSVEMLNYHEDTPRVREQIQAAVKSGKPYRIEYRIVWPDGSLHWVAAYGQVYKSGRKPIKMIGTVRNIDDQKQSEEKFRMAVTAGKIATWDWDLISGRIERSPEYQSLLGLVDKPLNETLASYTAMIHPEDRQNVIREVNAAIRLSDKFEITYRIITPKKDVRWLTDRGRIYRNSNGKAIAIRGTCIDVTDIKTYTEAKRTNEGRLTLALEASKLGLWEWDMENDTLSWSESLKRLYGLPQESDVTYESYLSMIHPDDLTKLKDILKKAMQHGKSYMVEHRVIWPDGSIHWMQGQGRAYLRNGKAYRMIGTSMNIDEQKDSELQLRESEMNFRELFDNAPEAIIVTSQDGSRILRSNHAASRLLGYTTSEFAKIGLTHLVRKKDMFNLRELQQAKSSCTKYFGELPLRRKDGRIVGAEMTAKKLPDGSWLAFIRDISERIAHQKVAQKVMMKERLLKEKAAFLREQQKQMKLISRTKDEFLSVASHHLRTPVTAVKTYLAMLRDGYVGELTPEQLAYIEQAFESNEQQLGVIDDILNVAEVDAEHVVLRRKRQNIVRLTTEVIDSLTDKFERREQRIKFKTSHTSVLANVDTVKFRLVIENLIGNASKYSPGGTNIYISIQQLKDKVRIAVTDEGMGIKESDIGRIFDKFARIRNQTYRSETGTGLGLYWAKRIVEMHGGKISVKSSPEKGSTFTLTIPIRPS